MPYGHLVLLVDRIAQEGDQVTLPFFEDMDASFVSCLVSYQTLNFVTRHSRFRCRLRSRG